MSISDTTRQALVNVYGEERVARGESRLLKDRRIAALIDWGMVEDDRNLAFARLDSDNARSDWEINNSLDRFKMDILSARLG